MLLVWTPGPANNLNRPTTTPYYDAGIYLLKNGQAVTDYRNLVIVKNNPNYNELQPKAVVPYSAIYGIAQPAALPYLPNDGSLSASLPPGTPFGLIGTSSFYNRNTTPGYGATSYNGLDSLNTSENGESSNWFEQGADAGKYSNSDIYAVRILAMEGVSHRSYPSGADTGFINFAEKERLRILGEIPLRKTDAGGATVLDPQGNPDTSFLAKVPADTPFSFQTLDKNGLVLNMAQTWHVVRPGEVRNDCGGCHAHNKLPVDFSSTAAALSSYQATDLTTQATLLTKDGAGNTIVKLAGRLVVDVEYYKDIKPILQRSCVQCHSKSGTAAAGLVLDDTTLANGYDNTYNRLANDTNAQWGAKPVISNGQWRQTNASRYVRMFQSRRSLLAWKVFGQRLDGWTNTDHPTETTPGVASTLPGGANPNLADIDYTGSIMPPPGSGVPALSEDEKMTIARWIDLGAPITVQGDPSYKGYFADEIKPTVALSSPRSGLNAGSLASIRIGMFDAYSGINLSSLSVTTNFAVNGSPAGTELGPSFLQTDPSVWALALTMPVTSLPSGHIVVRVKDNAGNYMTVDRWFTIGGSGTAPPAPVLTSPANSVSAVSVTQTLSWAASTGATSYDVYFGASANPPLIANTVATNFATGSLSTGALYRWRVVAKNSTGSTSSVLWSFTTIGPHVDTISPHSGSGAGQSFTFAFSDPEGYTNLDVLNVLINNSLDGRFGCYLAYSRPANVLYLMNDAGSGLLPGIAMNGSGSLGNSYCTIAGAGSSAVGNGSTITLTLSISFNSTNFSGDRIIYVAGRDLAARSSGWQARGTWRVPGGTAFTVSSLSPSSGTGLSQTFTVIYHDATSALNITNAQLLINADLNGDNGCYLGYVRATNLLYLVNDLSPGLQPPIGPNSGAGQAQNSQCILSGSGTTATISGTDLILSINLTFTANFTGSKVVYAAAQTAAGNTGWQARGVWIAE